MEFEKPNTAAQTWSIDVEINDTITIHLSENKLGDELSVIYSDREVKYISKEHEKRKKDKNNIFKGTDISIKNIEIIYKKG